MSLHGSHHGVWYLHRYFKSVAVLANYLELCEFIPDIGIFSIPYFVITNFHNFEGLCEIITVSSRMNDKGCFSSNNSDRLVTEKIARNYEMRGPRWWRQNGKVCQLMDLSCSGTCGICEKTEMFRWVDCLHSLYAQWRNRKEGNMIAPLFGMWRLALWLLER